MKWPNRSDVFLRAKPYVSKKVKTLPLFVEAKHDGHRILIVKDEDKILHAYTRTAGIDYCKDKAGFAEALPEWIKNLPKLTAVETEMEWPEHEASDVPTAVKEFPEQLVFIPFAMPFHKGQDIRWMGYMRMRELIQEFSPRMPKYQVFENIKPPAFYLEAQAKKAGLEGFIVKESGYSGWWKAKVTHTIDLKLVGFKDGQGKYEGEVGAMEMADAEDVHIFCSGMTDEIRFSLSDKDLGRLAEIKHNGVTSGGKLRHPRFVRWRDDKEEVDVIQRNKV